MITRRAFFLLCDFTLIPEFMQLLCPTCLAVLTEVVKSVLTSWTPSAKQFTSQSHRIHTHTHTHTHTTFTEMAAITPQKAIFKNMPLFLLVLVIICSRIHWLGGCGVTGVRKCFHLMTTKTGFYINVLMFYSNYNKQNISVPYLYKNTWKGYN